MKNILKSTLLLMCSVGLFAACSDDNDSNPTIGSPTTFTLNTPSYAALPVDLTTSTELAFTWSQPDYGFPVAAEYQLQASIDGNFTISTDEAALDESGKTIPNYVILPSTFQGGNGTINANTLATAVNAMGQWEEIPETQQLTIRASAKLAGSTIYSNTVNIIVVPAKEVAPAYAMYIFEIGNEGGWSNNHALCSPAQDGIYTGYYWLDGEFKFKPNEGNWDGDWEYNGEGTETTGLIEDNGGPNCPDPGAGFYQIKVSLVDMTYNLLPITNVSIIGAFNDWAGDVEMTYNSEGYWEVTTDAVSGEYKFRANHAWDINWGGTEDNLTQDGANLSSDGGTHTYKLYITYEGNNYVVIE